MAVQLYAAITTAITVAILNFQTKLQNIRLSVSKNKNFSSMNNSKLLNFLIFPTFVQKTLRPTKNFQYFQNFRKISTEISCSSKFRKFSNTIPRQFSEKISQEVPRNNQLSSFGTYCIGIECSNK